MSDVIFSLSHSSIGRSTDDPGTAAAHLKYILREGACESVIARGIPDNALEAAAWITKQEINDRKNARVCDKVMMAPAASP